MLGFALSPEGDMELNHLRIAILNYLFSQQHNKYFLLRIKDGKTKKNIEGKDTEIIEILEKFAIKYSSVSHESEHLHLHQTLAIKLLEEEKAFVCTCSPERLAKDKEDAQSNDVAYHYLGHCTQRDKAEHATLKASNTPFVLRLKHPQDAFIILREDNTPSDNFASACDDMLSNISMIIRSDELLLDTKEQIDIKQSLGYDRQTEYQYIPSMRGTEEYSIQWLFEEGYIPDAILNYLLVLGYKDAPKEIFTLPEAIEWFDLESITSADIYFDIEALAEINTRHLLMMDDKRLSSLFGFADTNIGKLAKLYLGEVHTTKALSRIITAIFSSKDFDGKWGKEMRILEKEIQNAPYFPAFSDFETYMLDASGLKKEDFSFVLRLLLTAREEGPALSEIYPFLNAYLLELAS
jgi:glutamyl-tRNA synthetase